MGERSRDKEKRPAPISSSAFSFSLGTPAKRAKPAPAKDVTPRPEPTRRGEPSSLLLTTPLPPPPPTSKSKPMTPLSLTRNKSLTPFTPPRRTDLSTLPSPFGLSPFSVPKDSRRHALSETPFRLKQRDERTKQAIAITSIPRVSTGAEAGGGTQPVNEEGIGVSPRRNKTIQHKGPGPPVSVRLGSLVSAANTSLVLFYTALQHTLSRKSRVECMLHVKTASLQFRVVRVVDGTHGAVMLECEGKQKERVLVVLQTLPGECPRIGVDARLVDGERGREVGVWGPWSDVEMGGRRVVFAARYLVVECE